MATFKHIYFPRLDDSGDADLAVRLFSPAGSLVVLHDKQQGKTAAAKGRAE